ncbi:MAG: lactate racemase domain-containing protein [Sphaerochaetaceae bacterium]|nr:lactate racemase domain-containing protein [Sphaerochaetaceae bacterium]
MMLETGGNGSFEVIENLLKDIRIPKFVKVKQKFIHPQAVDVASEIRNQLKDSPLWAVLKPGDTVAITVGSRGIVNMVTAVRTVGALIKEHGGKPFMIPAMGSHAGATAQGQTNMLLGLGYTQEATGMEIHATMDTVEISRTPEENLPVLIDRNAYEADHVVIMNRIKPHVCFRGHWESGLMKMITIGMGKQKGAETAHNLGFGHMPEHIRQIATEALKHMNVLFAVGLVENAYHETCIAKVMSAKELPETEKELLIKAKEYAAKLYFESLNALIIDEIGKNISGSGFDTNVVGRYHSAFASGGPKINRVIILDIAEKSHGNGNGLGMADFTTLRAAQKFDFAETYPNTLTALLTGGVKIPMVLPNDKLGLQACMKTSNLENWEDTKFVRIHNTLCLDEIEVSENLAEELKKDSRFEIIGEPYELTFDTNGNLF